MIPHRDKMRQVALRRFPRIATPLHRRFWHRLLWSAALLLASVPQAVGHPQTPCEYRLGPDGAYAARRARASTSSSGIAARTCEERSHAHWVNEKAFAKYPVNVAGPALSLSFNIGRSGQHAASGLRTSGIGLPAATGNGRYPGPVALKHGPLEAREPGGNDFRPVAATLWPARSEPTSGSHSVRRNPAGRHDARLVLGTRGGSLDARGRARAHSTFASATQQSAGGYAPAGAPPSGQPCEDVNTATIAALQKVKGIGPAKARAIVEYRAQHGPFQSMDELTNVRGIGPATLENFRLADFCVKASANPDGRAANPPGLGNEARSVDRAGCEDINTASGAALQQVSGIGPPKARRITEFRERNGAFSSLDELVRVRGIGPATLENIRQAGFCAEISDSDSNSEHSSFPMPRQDGAGSFVPYEISLYDHWTDDDNDCQNTRQEVLISESLQPVVLDDAGCTVLSGAWFDPFTGFTVTDPGDLDIDHFIRLAEAHRSGAGAWNSSRRRAFANNLLQPGALIAVLAGANRSKGDRDPAGWLPPNEAYRCEYVRNWVEYKAARGLYMDAVELQTVVEILSDCLTEMPPMRASDPIAWQDSAAIRADDCTDINTADSEALQSVNGVGLAKARSILEFVEQNGPFETLSQVAEVRGIGPVLLERIHAAGFCVAPTP